MLMTLGEDNKSEKLHKVDITDYQDVADCIRSDQVPANHIAEYFSDKKFYQWYKKKSDHKRSKRRNFFKRKKPI